MKNGVFWMLSLSIFLMSEVSLKASVPYDTPKENVHIVLPERVVIHKKRYTLGDMAELQGNDPMLIEKLASVEIGRAPLPGGSLTVTKSLIMSRLRPHVKNVQVVFVDHHQTTIERSALRVLGEDIDQLVLDHINQVSEDQEIKPKLISKSADILLPRGELEYHVKLKGKPRKEGGYRVYEVTFKINNKVVKRVPVRAYLKVYKDVYVAKDTIKDNQLIAETDLKKVRTNVDRAPMNYITQKDAVIGKLAKRTIGANEVIKANSIEIPPAVKTGDRLLIIFETPSLRLTVPGMAMNTGGVGEVIMVRNLQSKVMVQATIQNSNTVLVN